MFFHTATQKRLEIQMWTFWRTIETTNWTIEHAHLDCCCDFTTWFMKKIILDEICWDKIWNWNLFIHIWYMSTSFLSLNYINLPSSCDERCQPSVQTCDLPRISSRQHRPVIGEEMGAVRVTWEDFGLGTCCGAQWPGWWTLGTAKCQVYVCCHFKISSWPVTNSGFGV